MKFDDELIEFIFPQIQIIGGKNIYEYHLQLRIDKLRLFLIRSLKKEAVRRNFSRSYDRNISR